VYVYARYRSPYLTGNSHARWFDIRGVRFPKSYQRAESRRAISSRRLDRIQRDIRHWHFSSIALDRSVVERHDDDLSSHDQANPNKTNGGASALSYRELKAKPICRNLQTRAGRMEQSGFDACATMSNDFRVNMHDAYPRVYIDLSSVGFSVRFLQRAIISRPLHRLLRARDADEIRECAFPRRTVRTYVFARGLLPNNKINRARGGIAPRFIGSGDGTLRASLHSVSEKPRKKCRRLSCPILNQTCGRSAARTRV